MAARSSAGRTFSPIPSYPATRTVFIIFLYYAPIISLPPSPAHNLLAALGNMFAVRED
ncbi:MAG: hypothetical protein HOL12_03500 [Kordiimonadaceae bacterium]|nr:hypothetical protein [Kordiimonadaceae bacterium]MBT6134160.1 hypothetical protein [Kordiimonadaceae bacterium]MBT6467535.1 hypothetical protein [Kordiimonadaceae bacterium]